MSIRIISGIHGSRRIECPDTGVRPTTDRVKESIFSIIFPYIQDANVLDLFAGSGSLGIEALSRGASHATFVDKSPKSIRFITKNIDMLREESRSRIIRSDVLSYISGCSEKFDLIFMDPPYDRGLASKIATPAASLLKPETGLLVIEHSPEEVVDIANSERRTYGDTIVTLVRS